MAREERRELGALFSSLGERIASDDPHVLRAAIELATEVVLGTPVASATVGALARFRATSSAVGAPRRVPIAGSRVRFVLPLALGLASVAACGSEAVVTGATASSSATGGGGGAAGAGTTSAGGLLSVGGTTVGARSARGSINVRRVIHLRSGASQDGRWGSG